MNGEHKTGGGEAGATTEQPELTPEEKAKLDEEARRRQDPAQHPRMQAMAAIAQKHEDDIEEQLAAEGLSSRTVAGEQPVNDTRTQGPVDDTQRGRPAAQPTDDQQGRQPSQQQPQQQRGAKPAAQFDLQAFGADPVPMEALDELKVKVKIDGQERVMSLHELRRTAQIDGAAMARLEQANELLRKAREAAAGGTQQPPVGVDGKPQGGDSSTASKDVTDAAAQLVDALFVGDKDAAVATVTKLLQGPQPAQALDPEAFAARVVPAVKQQLSQEEAEAQFRSDFKDVVSDPILVDVADRFFAEAQAADPQKSYAELLSEAGNATRDWLATRTGSPATGQGKRSTRQEKLEAKARLDEPRSLQRTEGKDEPAIPTHSQVIEDMRRQRGLV